MGTNIYGNDDANDYLKENFVDWYQRMQKKCKYYDEDGDISIVTDMAVQMRVLLHDTKNSESLLEWIKSYLKIDLKDPNQCIFLDTTFSGWKEKPMDCFENISNSFVKVEPTTSKYALLAVKHQGGDKSNASYFPVWELYEDTKHNPVFLSGLCQFKRLNFKTWWKLNPICLFYDINGKLLGQLTRQDIVLALCHKDGGAHYDLDDLSGDKFFNSSYLLLKNKPELHVIINGKRERTELMPLQPIMREIAYELLESLRPFLKTL